MTKKPAAPTVDSLLDELPEHRKTRAMDAYPELRAALVRFLDLKATNDERARVSFQWFYQNKLQPTFGGPTHHAARNWIRDVLKRDASTGKAL